MTENAFQFNGSRIVELASTMPTLSFVRLLFESDHCRCLTFGNEVLKLGQSDQVKIQLQLQFATTYVDTSGVVIHFVTNAEECSSIYTVRSAVFKSPYFALVQSSGSGKSRMLLEASKLLRTLYVCFRQGMSGYPVRSTSAIAALFSGLSTLTEDAYMEDLVSRLRKAELSAHKNLPIPNESDCHPLFASEKFEEKVWDLDKISCDDTSVKIEEVTLLVFDEARELLQEAGCLFGVNQFRLFRRALREYRARYSDSRLFAVMVDTSSRIQNFSPSSNADPSARQVAGEGGRLLFHPFVLRGSFDALFQDKKLPHNTQDLSCLLASENYLLAGRPLVAIQLGSKDQRNQFLLRKLNGGSDKITNNGGLSTVLCRLATSISCQASVASDLVADHMAYLLAADKEREQLFISFLAEPRMAAAAASLWKSDQIFVERLLPALQHAMITGVVSAGCRGEIVGQIILLKAFMLHVKNATSHQDPVFLCSLFWHSYFPDV